MKANDKQLRFILEIDERLKGVVIISDPTRLSQLIYNLASNAIKFTEQGSIAVKLDCIHKAENEVSVQFSVADTGIGIHPNKHEAIFEMFAQADARITRQYGGTGLGLAIVKQLLSLFNGSIQLQSTLGKGSVFSFTVLFTTTTSIAETESEVSGRTDLSYLRVLVAEDNPFNRMIIRKQFNKLGIEPTVVENGRQAYDACLSGTFDVLLIDLHMPEVDGYATISMLRAIENTAKANVYIIAFTASVNEQQKIAEYGFDDYLYKPVNMADLREKLEQMIEKSAV